MKVNIQAIVLASLVVCSVRCLTIPSSFEKTLALLEQTNQEQQSHSYDGSQISSDSDRGYPVLSSTVVRDDDELSNEEKTLALAATVYENLAPLVQLAGALPDKKPIEGLTKTKSGYSKVITTTVADRQQGETSDSSSNTAADSSSSVNEAAVVVDDVTSETSSAAESGIGKSIEKSKESGVVGGGGVNKYHAVGDEDDEDEDVFEVETIVPGRGVPTQFSPSLSAKEYMAIFMRENLLPASQSANVPLSAPGSSQPMAAKLTINDDASAPLTVTEEDPEAHTHMREEMEKRLADFVENFMSGVLQAKMHEVRVEQRANGLQDYRTS